MSKRRPLVEGAYYVVDSATGKVRGKSFKRLAWAEAHAQHLSALYGRHFSVAKAVA